jgi:hypothetical protein
VDDLARNILGGGLQGSVQRDPVSRSLHVALHVTAGG